MNLTNRIESDPINWGGRPRVEWTRLNVEFVSGSKTCE